MRKTVIRLRPVRRLGAASLAAAQTAAPADDYTITQQRVADQRLPFIAASPDQPQARAAGRFRFAHLSGDLGNWNSNVSE